MVYYVYFIKTLDTYPAKTYVGYTNNLNKRLEKHNSNLGAKSTKGYKWEIIYKKIKKPAYIFDGRNILNSVKIKKIGFNYIGLGRK